MKSKSVVALLILTVLLAGCKTKTEDLQPPLGAGFRFSTYGAPTIDPQYWVSVGQRMSAKFPGSVPETIWIVGNIYGEGTYLNFPCETEDPNIRCGFMDMNDQALKLFDELGFRVWLQVEAGNASVDELVDIVLNQYQAHPSVIGFGLDVEWYKSPSGPLGVPITDEEALRWTAAVQAHNPEYRLFLKHWEIEWMPPTVREGIFFVNDTQDFDSLNAMLANFSAWGAHFAPSPVGYQFGYDSDRKWWRELHDPPREIGETLLENIPNTQALYWVDFTVQDVFPEE
jgi:hypothetical protein